MKCLMNALVCVWGGGFQRESQCGQPEAAQTGLPQFTAMAYISQNPVSSVLSGQELVRGGLRGLLWKTTLPSQVHLNIRRQ